MNVVENKPDALLRPTAYWRLWLLNTVLVSGGMLFFLAAQYGTLEFFGRACLMALLPFIPLAVLVGGAGSTIFVLTKVMIEKRGLKLPAALALLLGPGLAVTLLLVLLGTAKSPGHRLAYICLGHSPATATNIRVTGYSTFLREEWLATFQVSAKDFQAMVAGAQMTPADEFEFRKLLDQSSFKQRNLLPNSAGDRPCFKRVFKESEEHQRGRVYAEFDPATSTAMVFREYRD